jgi:hypothetical protein
MPTDSSEHCTSCHSDNLSTFNGEVAIHFLGPEGLKKPIVFVFPKLLICLKCGFAELTIPERELRVLQTGTPVEGAVISEDRLTGGDDVQKKPG